MFTMKIAILLALSLALTQGRHLLVDHNKDSKPWFCHDLDCPKFKVLNTTKDYELRAYESGYWATTQTDALLYSVGVAEGFKRLFKYISGANEGSKKIPMTVPVAVAVAPGQGPFCKSHYVVGFFIPFEYQDDPPKPTSNDVYIEKIPAKTFGVMQFGGYVVDEWTLGHKVNLLKDALDADSISYNASRYFSVGYDAPTRLQHRHNEVWLELESGKNAVTVQSAGLLSQDFTA